MTEKKRAPKNGYAPKKEVADKPYVPSAFDLPSAYALQALERGAATEDQQIKALQLIVNSLCKTYDMSYRPESQRDTDFSEGKRFVGLQIVSIIKRNLNIYKPKQESEE